MAVVETLRLGVASRRRTLTHELAFILIGAAALAASARVSFPLPFSPVPVTTQTLVVLLLGALLGSVRGTASVCTYLAAGTLCPVLFAVPTGLAGPTGGYLLGFALAAAAVGWLLERGWQRRPAGVIAALLIGETILFAAGLAWLSFFPLPKPLLMAGLVPFLPGEAVKLPLACLVLAWTRR